MIVCLLSGHYVRGLKGTNTQYTEDVGWAVTAGIPVKIGIAHGKSVPEIGSAKRIGAYGRKGVPPAPQISGTSEQKIIPPTDLLIPIHNIYSLTICS